MWGDVAGMHLPVVKLECAVRQTALPVPVRVSAKCVFEVPAGVTALHPVLAPIVPRMHCCGCPRLFPSVVHAGTLPMAACPMLR